jgi:hypothetical protein
MEPQASSQPFMCHVCYISFGSGKALSAHLKEKHEPKWTESDRRFLKSIKITVEE